VRVDRRAERGQATRENVVAVATRLFAERGFEGTSIEAVLDEAGVSRGSLYHHFASKEALFEAVFQATETRIGEDLLQRSAGITDPVEILHTGSLGWMELAGDPVVQRIVLIDAPAVLGWERWRAIEEENTLGAIKAGMQIAAQAGRLPPELADAFAHALLAAVNELALMIARSDDQKAAQRTAQLAIDEMFDRLFGS
jgi:AcrR family transcriptional regulator